MGVERLRELGGELRSLRVGAGWSGRELARRAGVAQATVSRVENGHRVDTPATVERIVAALPIEPDAAESLRLRVRESYAELAERRRDAGVSLAADAVKRWERGAAPVREFHSGMIPRALRSAEYARTAEVPVSSLAGQLGGGSREFGFVVTEGALRTWPGDGSMMADQLAAVLRACESPQVRLGVIPWTAALPVVPPHGFTLFGDEAVLIETFTAEMTLTEPGAVAAYVEAYARLEEAAVTGDEMRELLRHIQRDYEKLPRMIQ
jgi:transcriptional regulator with XRE-family HTH domain